jgi:hypothetical protein
MKTLVWVQVAVLTLPLISSSGSLRAQQAPSGSSVALDYEYFKTQVQPVFLTKRAGYTRCVVCHSQGGQVGFLQPLSPGATTWNEEESRKNFERVSKLVTPGEPLKSVLLRHPLEPTAGGDEFHNGGRQFTSQDDPQFKTIAAWVRGQTASASAR